MTMIKRLLIGLTCACALAVLVWRPAGAQGITKAGGGAPGGSTTQVQFNDAGAFGGDAGLTYAKATDTLTTGTLIGGTGTNSAPTFTFTGETDTGFYSANADEIDLAVNGTRVHRFGTSTLNIAHDNANFIMGAFDGDVGLARNAAGVVEFNSGTRNTYRDAKLRMLRVGQATPPTCSASCGTSPTVVGSDTAMIVTMGSSGVPASPFTVTFNGTWAATPSCIAIASKTGMVAGKAPILAVASTTTVIVTTNGTAPSTTDTYAIHCIGVQ